MDTSRHLPWEIFDAHFVRPGLPARHRIAGTPDVFLTVEAAASRIGLMVAVTTGDTPGRITLAQLSVRQTAEQGRQYLEISTASSNLFREFYSLMMTVADLVQLEGKRPGVALELALETWEQLLRQAQILSIEEQLGLIGELWTLRRLASTQGSAAIDAWVGPARENHDFRTGNAELEVKTTSQIKRLHIIHGLRQLEPGQSNQLYLLSLHIQSAGNSQGLSLNDHVQGCRNALVSDTSRLAIFERLLAARGYRDADTANYSEKYNMRSQPRLIDVVAGCPRLTVQGVADLLGPEQSVRVEDVRYTINVEGLGSSDGTANFLAVLPA